MIRFDAWLAEHMVHRDEITPDPMNDNNGDVDALIESLEVNGCYRPIYAHADTHMITAGHTLYAALLEAGHTFLPVVYGDVDEEKHRRRLVADNQVARRARPDHAQTIQLLDTLRETELGLLGSGFTEDEYVQLMLREHPAGPGGGWGLGHAPAPLRETTCPECGHTWSD